MAYVALFVILALLEILSATMIFLSKNILHTVLALSSLFVMNSALFLVLGQPLLALLQLFIMVGGVSTYIFVGVAAAGYSKFKGTNYTVLVAVYLVIFILFSVRMVQVNPIIQQQNLLSGSFLSQTLGTNIGLLYLMVILLFGTGLGSIILMRKLGDKK